MPTGIRLGYKIKYNQNKTTRRYLYNNKWVPTTQVPEIRKKHRLIGFNYMNTERGCIKECVDGIFKIKDDKRKKKWIPEMDKKGIWLIIMNHICRMKEQFPDSDGRLCFFCKKPWTYIKRRNDGSGKTTVTLTNFSLDRFNCEETYKEGNIVCCHISCNFRKGSSTPKDWRVYIEAEKELKRINEME